MTAKPTLFLIPVPIDDEAIGTIPANTIEVVHQLHYFVVEKSKTARKFLKMVHHPLPQSMLQVEEIPKHDKLPVQDLLQPLMSGHSIGILSESGCPGIADPGAELVAYAHRHNIPVQALTGPSSILLALMGSGLSGQKFTFHGYLPNDKAELVKKLKSLEADAIKNQHTHLFIETPYRNIKLFETIVSTLLPETVLSLHIGLTGPKAFSKSNAVKNWLKFPKEGIPTDVPAVFIIGIL